MQMYTFSVDGKIISVFPAAGPDAPVIYLNTVSDEGQGVFQTARGAGCPPFTLVAIRGLDWNHDMAPWDSPPAFRNGQPFTGGAREYLELLTRRILPAAEQTLVGPPRWRGIAGYSLAGLFALYAICHTDAFSRVGSMSGSLWFPGIREYLHSHAPPAPAGVHLLLPGGPREQDPQSRPETGPAEHPGDPGILSGPGN